MTRIFVHSIFLLCLLTGITSCQKNDPTIIMGTITDSKTGLPIDGATISGGTIYQKTGIDGKFKIAIGENDNLSGLTIQKEGYVVKFRLGTVIKHHETNEVAVVMHPRDAILRMVYENSSGIQKPIYLQAQSKTFIEEYGQLPFIITQPYPYLSQPNSRDTLDYAFTSDEQINLYWGFVYYEKAGQALLRDSLHLSSGDTATYFIFL